MPLLDTLKFITEHPLNHEQKIKSVVRFVKWQLGSRLIPGEVVYEWINGSKFLVRTGETGLTGNIYTGLHEFLDMGFLLHVLRPEDLFIDIGANVGSYTILACSAIGARGFAYEPVPSTYQRLVNNMRLNHLDKRVVAINSGVGSEVGSIAFTSDSDTTNHALADDEKQANSINVDMLTLDSSLQHESPFLIKIDVEGYELPALEGAKQTLQKESLKAVIMELNGSGNRYGYDEGEILNVMLEYGFKTYSYDPFDRSLINLDGKNLHSGNTLFVRNKSLVEQRLKNASKVFVNGRQF